MMVQLGEYPTEAELKTMVAEVDQVNDNDWEKLNLFSFIQQLSLSSGSNFISPSQSCRMSKNLHGENT